MVKFLQSIKHDNLAKLFFINFLKINFDATLGAQQSKSMQQIEFKLTQLRNCLLTIVPLRLLVPVLNDELTTKNENSVVVLIKDNLKFDTIEYYMQIIKITVKKAKQGINLTFFVLFN